MINKSISIAENLSLINKSIVKNSISFSDFQKLNLGGSQKILTFGEYCQKRTYNKANRRKVIYYFYKRIKN